MSRRRATAILDGLSRVRQPSITIVEGPCRQFVESTEPFVALFGGRGSAKTSHLVHKVFLTLLRHPGARGVLTEPNYGQVERVLVPAIEELWGDGRPHIWDWGPQRLSVQFTNGSWLRLHYGDGRGASDSLRGMNLMIAGMDEAAAGDQEATFRVLAGCLRQRLEGQEPPRQLCVATTPNGMDWLFRTFVESEDGGLRTPGVAEDGFLYVHASPFDNPFLPPGFIKALKAVYGTSPWADQEIYGRFVSVAGRAFPMFNPTRHVAEPPPGVKWRRYWAGVDFGVTSPTAAVLVGESDSGRVWVLAEFYKSHATVAELADALLRWPSCRIACDPSQPATIEELRRLGLHARPARSNKFYSRVSHVAQRLGDGPDGRPLISLSPVCQNLITEVSSLTFAAGGEDYGRHQADHAVDALAYALMELDSLAPGVRPKPTITRWFGR